jgi:hypothetical protein
MILRFFLSKFFFQLTNFLIKREREYIFFYFYIDGFYKLNTSSQKLINFFAIQQFGGGGLIGNSTNQFFYWLIIQRNIQHKLID